jgi:hypothetical protein
MANKQVEVEVNLSSTAITVSVSEDPVTISPYDGIDWTVKPAGWEFAKDSSGDSIGIVIKNPGNRFRDKKESTKGKHEWERLRRDNPPKLYRYTINVVQTAHPEFVVTWDPSIMND